MPTPEDILAQMQRPAHWDGWVPTSTGKGYRPWDDDPGTPDLDDVVHGLAHTFRYGGQTNPPITVAEHSVLAAAILEILWADKPALVLAALLHDASEAYLHDIQAPLRRRIVVRLNKEEISWSESDRRVTQNIAKHFGVLPEHLDSPEVKASDVLACCFEKRDCPSLGDEDWGLPLIPPEVQHLKMSFWTPVEARLGFRLALDDWL